jgi:thiol-disulfide isomerase/thioredoxin
MTAKEILPQTLRAHELFGDFWFNSEPVLIAALRGQVILIEFWDYTCSSSIRTLPYIKEWERKYAPYGLVVVGVHTPKFPFGKDPDNVQKAIRRLQISYPVVMDNEATLATRYGAIRWPTMVVIDKDGFVRYQNSGEGDYSATEHALQTLLYHAGVGEELPLIMDPVRDADRYGAVLYRVTPELYAGYLRGSMGNVEGYSPESVVNYDDPGLYLTGRFYVGGQWMNAKDCIRLEGEEGQIVIDYEALEVNAVLKPENRSVVEATITQDDKPLTALICGEDVALRKDGRSILSIKEPRTYNLVRNREHGKHVLRMSLSTAGLSLYEFTFVASAIPELIPDN